jgi:hypothetical protein
MQHASSDPVATWVNDRLAEGHTPEQVRDLLWEHFGKGLRPLVEKYVEGELAVRRSGR